MTATEEFSQEIIAIIDNEIKPLFLKKNRQYKTNDDPLANFTTGAMLRYGNGYLPAKYETLKDYVNKHISHVYDNDLDGDKVGESLGDIVVYFLIAIYMKRQQDELHRTCPPSYAEVKDVAQVAKENTIMREALEKLSRLGNGERVGNSIGNEIAARALENLESEA